MKQLQKRTYICINTTIIINFIKLFCTFQQNHVFLFPLPGYKVCSTNTPYKFKLKTVVYLQIFQFFFHLLKLIFGCCFRRMTYFNLLISLGRRHKISFCKFAFLKFLCFGNVVCFLLAVLVSCEWYYG